MLRVNHISKTFFKGSVNEKSAVGDLSFTLNTGEFVVVIGGNGAGKSTLLNAVAGTFETDSGSIELDGVRLDSLPEHRRARYIGRVFQDPLRGTAPSMTIAENLAMAVRRGKRRGLSGGLKRADLSRYRESLIQLGLGLEDRLHCEAGLLSGGQRQALTLLMATISQPKLLLLDEHTAALDPATAKTVLDLTEKVIQSQQLSALMVTHNMRDALTCGDRMIMMHEGRIILELTRSQRSGMTVDDLVALFHSKSGEIPDDDRMLLA